MSELVRCEQSEISGVDEGRVGGRFVTTGFTRTHARKRDRAALHMPPGRHPKNKLDTWPDIDAIAHVWGRPVREVPGRNAQQPAGNLYEDGLVDRNTMIRQPSDFLRRS